MHFLKTLLKFRYFGINVRWSEAKTSVAVTVQVFMRTSQVTSG
jgi:hypothetical protein